MNNSSIIFSNTGGLSGGGTQYPGTLSGRTELMWPHVISSVQYAHADQLNQHQGTWSYSLWQDLTEILQVKFNFYCLFRKNQSLEYHKYISVIAKQLAFFVSLHTCASDSNKSSELIAMWYNHSCCASSVYNLLPYHDLFGCMVLMIQ